jgi:hypothetical protein
MGEIHMYGGKREEETKHVPLLLYLLKLKSYGLKTMNKHFTLIFILNGYFLPTGQNWSY